MKKLDIFGAIVSTVLCATSATGWADLPSSTLSEQCEALTRLDLSRVPDAPARISDAKFVDAKNNVPEHCQVQGYVAPQIGFEVRLPTRSWNRKFIMVGCGGFCGVLWGSACDEPLRKGYSCVITDMGHKGGLGDGLWAYNNLQAKLDYGYRATHVAALIGKVITEQHYRSAPARSYFLGCSTGGRQGLVSAQRFPWDFDGIVAGAPTIDTAALAVYALQVSSMNLMENGDRVLPPSALRVIHQAALAKCDLDDGVKDGIISHPPSCRIDPGEAACQPGQTDDCLTDAQVEATQKIYAGITTSRGERIHPGPAVGSELTWDLPYASIKNQFVSAFQYLKLIPDPGSQWTLAEFEAERDYKRALTMEPIYAASNPDLRKFKASGGKLILYSGWNDPLIVPASIVDYYEAVERTMGGREATQDFFRLFMIPGMNHCTGGDGASKVDFLSHLEAWVENAQAPQKIVGAHEKEKTESTAPDDAKRIISFTRPMYPYPTIAKYVGRGDPNDASNFRPVNP